MLADKAFQSSLKWLADQQQPAGNFVGQASPTIKPFHPARNHPTNFFTALIMVCLENVAGSEAITETGCRFLKNQGSDLGSWNYWQRPSDMARKFPYPDDLDDTAYALLALSLHDPDYLDGELLARLAKLLIASEVQPGGPYRTWLVKPELYTQWGDVDLAVNANIGALMARQQIQLAGLEAYIDHQLSQGSLNSAYYVGAWPLIYFLSGWYQGSQLNQLRQATAAAIKSLPSGNSLQLALALTAGSRLKLPRRTLKRLAQALVHNRQSGHWEAQALYVDPVIDGKQYFAGSAALSTALALEALVTYHHEAATIKPARRWPLINSLGSGSLSPDMAAAYRAMAQTIISADTDGQITGLANHIARAYAAKLTPKQARHLNLASLNGWIAYSIYDDFLDEEARPEQLSIANYALRQVLKHYQAALPEHRQFQSLVQSTLDNMDSANYREVTTAHIKLTDKTSKLPDYGDYDLLAKRAGGHSLTALGSLIALGHKLDSAEVKHWQVFFNHYLIAKQLNDDAHDWQIDLKKGHFSPVVCLLLKSYPAKDRPRLVAEQSKLQQHFWQVTINQVAVLINDHLGRARQSLFKTACVRPDYFINLLDGLQRATDTATKGSQQIKKFINTYKTPTKD